MRIIWCVSVWPKIIEIAAAAAGARERAHIHFESHATHIKQSEDGKKNMKPNPNTMAIT